MQDALKEAGILDDVDWEGSRRFALSSGSQLLIIEFMRPGLTVDRNHMDRFQLYVDTLRSRISANTALGFRDITGLLVADALHRRPSDQKAIERMANDGMHCEEWGTLLGQAESQWKEFLFVLAERAPDDDRVRALVESEKSIDSAPAESVPTEPN